MKLNFRPASLAWLAMLAASAWWIVFVASRQIAQIEQVSDEVPAAGIDDASPTGYVRGVRNLLLPVGSAAGQPWIIEAQRTQAATTSPAGTVDYDNAPVGRPRHGTAPYRSWVRTTAAVERSFSGLSEGRAIERAALHAGPALHVLLVIVLGAFIAWQLGAASGALLGAGIAVLLVQTESFAAGRLEEHSLFLACSLAGVLAFVAGLQRERASVLFLLSGAASALALWIDAQSELIVLGAWVAATLASIALSPRASWTVDGWRSWALGGTAVGLAGWFIEGRPGGLAGKDLGAIHPLHLIAWWGAAEMLTRASAWRRGGSRSERMFFAAGVVVAAAAVGWLAFRSGQPTGHVEANASGGSLWVWLRLEGLGSRQVAILLPLLVLPLAAWLWRRPAGGSPALRVSAIATVILVGLGAWQLRWWNLATVAQLSVLAVLVPAVPQGLVAIGWRSLHAILLVPAMAVGWPRFTRDQALTTAEAHALVERDLAQWLAGRSEPGAVAYAPSALSASLCYYGGLRVVASPYPGNADGRAFATRIAAVSSPDEAQALVQRRGIQYLVLPSWDDTLDTLARRASDKPERSLIALLRQWLPPRWLRPVAYQMPVIPGLEQDSLVVFEVVEPQDNTVALSRLAEYFVETGRLQLAAAVGDSLAQSFAADAGAMIARARVALARNESRTLARILPELLPAIADGRDEDLPWERRVSLALVLAQAKYPDPARHQVEFCVQEADRDRLRSLGPVTLLRFLELARAMHLDFTDPQLREYALRLLPAEFQAELSR